jgi:hypothetical protein
MQIAALVLILRAQGRSIFLFVALFFVIAIDQKRYSRKVKPCTSSYRAFLHS